MTFKEKDVQLNGYNYNIYLTKNMFNKQASKTISVEVVNVFSQPCWHSVPAIPLVSIDQPGVAGTAHVCKLKV